MKIIDRYLIKEVISPFFLALFVFAMILMTDVLIRSIEIFINNRVSFSLILRFLSTSLPLILQLTIPMSVLTSVLIAYGRLASDSEVIALKANGISLYRLAAPVSALSIVAWIACLFISIEAIPRSGTYRQNIAYEILESNINVGLKPHVFNSMFKNLILYCDDIQPRSNIMKNVFMFQKEEKQANYIFAKEGFKKVFSDKKKIVLSLKNGIMHEISETNQDDLTVTSFNKKTIAIEFPNHKSVELDKSDYDFFLKELKAQINYFRNEVAKVNLKINNNFQKLNKIGKAHSLKPGKLKKVETSFHKGKNKSKTLQIKRQRRSLRKAFLKLKKENNADLSHLKTLKRRLNKLLIIYHKKFAFPLACLIFPLIAIPLGIRSKAGSKSTGFSISIAVILFYYIIEIGAEGMALESRIPVWLGIWAANLILTLFGIYLFIKVAREKEFKITNYITWKISFGFRMFVRMMRKGKIGLKEKEQMYKRKSLVFFNHSFPRVLDIYISREFIKILFLLILSIVSITVIMEFLTTIRFFLEHKANFNDFIFYIMLRIPFFVVLSIHVAVLISTILTINVFAKNNELTAMKTCGISLIRAAFPILTIALVIALGVFFFNERIVPNTNALAEKVLDYKIKKKSKPKLFTLNKNWYRGSNNSIYSFASFDQRDNKNVINDFLMYNLNNSFLPARRLKARSVIWNDVSHNWFYKNGEEISFDINGKPINKFVFNSKKARLTEKTNEFRRDIKQSDKMNYKELNSYIKSLHSKGIDTTTYRTDIMAKISMPFISFIIALFGIPFAITFQRSGTLVGIGFSIFIGMVYFIAYRVGISLGHSSQLPPFLAAWGANLLFGLTGLYLILKART